MSFDETSSFNNLLDAGVKCCRNGRWKPSVQTFEMTLLRNTARSRKRLLDGSYKPQKTNDFLLCERGKWRVIRAHNIRDRQVYKSFCEHDLKPTINNKIMTNNSASQEGKGTDHSIKLFRQGLAKATRKWGKDFYVITADDHNYFGSIPHDAINASITFSDAKSQNLIKQYVDIFKGDCGIGIGGEPSQDIAVVYQSKVDRMLACEPCVLASGRYMDDMWAICHTKEEARRVLEKIIQVSEMLGLVLNMKRTRISYMKTDSVLWLKKRTFIDDNGKIIMQLSRKNVTDKIKQLYYQKEKVDAGEMPIRVAFDSMQCWCSYAVKYKSRKQMIRVVKVFMELFDVPWDVTKLLFKRRNKGWIKMCEQRLLLYGIKSAR